MLGVGVVDRDDRELQCAVGRHRAQPDNACSGLLGAADHVGERLRAFRMDAAHDIRAVVHGDLRLVVDRSVDVRVVGLSVLALDGVGADTVLRHERRGDVILCRKRVARAQHDVSATGLERAHQVSGFCGDMQACRDAQSLKRLLCLKALADAGEYGHVLVGPFDASLAGRSQ